jgi:hypothetical protein
MRRKPVERDWSAALAKVQHEGKCRVCGRERRRGAKLEAAHVLGRKYDQPEVQLCGDELGAPYATGKLWVNPYDVVPLCSAFDGDCHGRYDRHEIDLWPYLQEHERSRAIELAGGLGPAERRIRGRHVPGL